MSMISGAWAVARLFQRSATEEDRVLGVLGLANTLAVSIGDAQAVLLVDKSVTSAKLSDADKVQSKSASRWGTRFIGPGMLMVGIALTATSLIGPARKYQTKATKESAILLGVSAMNAAVQIGMMMAMYFFAAAAGPIGMAISVLVSLLLPSAEALAALEVLRDQQATLWRDGRKAIADIVIASYIKTAELDILPITAMAHGVYAPANEKQMRIDMRNHGMLTALGDEAIIYQNSPEGIENAKVLAGAISVCDTQTSKPTVGVGSEPVKPAASKLTAVSLLNINVADQKDFYVSDTSINATYLSVVGVSMSSSNTVVTTRPQLSQLRLDGARGDILYTVTDQENAIEDSIQMFKISSDDRVSGYLTNKLVITSANKSQRVIYSIGDSNLTITGSAYKSNTYELTARRADNVSITGGSNGRDFVNYFKNKDFVDSVINLDQFTGVVVSGPEDMLRTTVIGKNADQSYMTGGSTDKVTLSGGFANVVVNGRGNVVQLSGGNNRLGVQLGVNPEFSPWSAVGEAMTAAGSYDGGTAVAATSVELSGAKNADGTQAVATFDGKNSLDLSGSLYGLTINLVEPDGIALSTATTINNANEQDQATFKNFQTVTGSSFGDNVTISGTKSLQKLNLGTGFNTVLAENVTGLNIQTVFNDSNNPNDIKLFDSTVSINASEASNNFISVYNSSVFAILQGQDSIFADNNTNNKVEAWVGSGYHKVDVIAGGLKINVYPVDFYQKGNNNDILRDIKNSSLAKASSVTDISVRDERVDVFINLSSDANEEYVRYVNGGFEFSTKDRGEVVNFNVVLDSDGDGKRFENDGFVRGSDGLGVGIYSLIDAMNFMENGSSRGYLAGKTYTLEQLFYSTIVPGITKSS